MPGPFFLRKGIATVVAKFQPKLLCNNKWSRKNWCVKRKEWVYLGFNNEKQNLEP